jgi:uncharacterized repeat protein (TIGR04076 family)
MTQERQQVGHKVVARVMDIKGQCYWGHKVGQEMEVSCHNTGGMCGFLYHDVFHSIVLLQFGGAYPWGDRDVVVAECPDRANAVKVELRRLG